MSQNKDLLILYDKFQYKGTKNLQLLYQNLTIGGVLLIVFVLLLFYCINEYIIIIKCAIYTYSFRLMRCFV